MTPRNEDFLFAQEAQRRGYLSEEQLDEGLLLQRRMSEELKIDERLAVILVKRGWLAEEQARRVYARIEPDDEKDEIQGYTLEEKIGHGAMGTVYRARHLGLQRDVAIKILRRDLARDEIQVERLKEEAKLLASLDHPNIVRALDAGESRGFPFIVMEYVEGETIKEKLGRTGPFDEIDALQITRGLADALERARRMGVVHRDVKPGNVILTKRGEPKLMDLGLAKGPVDLGLTQHGATVGTPQFISPEQAQDPRRADTRSDIYSLGATLYAMVTGRPPFNGTTLAEVLTKVLYEAPVPPRVANKKVSPEVSYLIERMMLKDPALRYRTPAEVVRDIDDVLAGRSIIPEGFTGNWEAYLLRQRIRRWVKIGTVAAALLLVVGGGTVMYVRHLAHQRTVMAAEAEVTRALRNTAVSQSDDVRSLQTKLIEARTTVARHGESEVEGLSTLAAQAWRLEKELQNFREVKDLRDRIPKRDELGDFAGLFDEIVALMEKFGSDSPATAVLRDDLKREVRLASQEVFEAVRNRARLDAATTLTGFLEAQTTYRDVLQQTAFYVEPEVTRARQEAAQAVRAITMIRQELDGLEQLLSGDALRTDLQTLSFAALRNTLHDEAERIRTAGSRAWGALSEEYISWRVVRGLLEDRIEAFRERLDEAFHAQWAIVREKARALHLEGQTRRAKDLLTRFADAAGDAGLTSLRASAIRERDEIDAKYQLAMQNAQKDYERIRRDVLERLRAGDPHGAKRRILQAQAHMSEEWPFRAKVEGLDQLAEAYAALFSRACDALVRLGKVEDVRLRTDRRERRWIIVRVVPGEAAVIVRTSRGGVDERRMLADVHPRQLEAWATPENGVLPALELAVAILASLPAEEPEDLRPYVRQLAALVEAFKKAGYEGGFSDWAVRTLAKVEGRLSSREANARSTISFIETKIAHGRFEDALSYLQDLEDSPGNLMFTDAFDEWKTQIARWRERVLKEVKNKQLVFTFPGAKIGVKGDETALEYDFEDKLQLRTWRHGAARATGVLEPYDSERPVTPRVNEHRFHLNRGVDSLIFDRPLVLPCIFDPALRIIVEFDMWALTSPFFHAIDIDGLQVGVLSADPADRAYGRRWSFPENLPLLTGERKGPSHDFYGRGRGVAFHHGTGFGDPRAWKWPAEGQGRNYERWKRSGRLGKELFAFQPGRLYKVKVVRDGPRIALYVDGELVLPAESTKWVRVGRTSDVDPKIHNRGTGRIQFLSWTPVAIDNLRVQGTVLERYLEND